MHPLQTVMIIGITSFVLVTAMLLVVRKMPSKPGIEWWVAGTLVLACSYLMALIFHGEDQTTLSSKTAFVALSLCAHIGFTGGTLLFFNFNFNKKLYFSVFLITFAVNFGLNSIGQALLADLCFVAFLSCSMLYVAYRLFQIPEKNKSIVFTAATYAAIGVHWLDYPFLRGIEWLAPIGFLIGMVLGIAMGLSLALLALLQFEKQTKESEQEAIYKATHDPLTGLYNRSHLSELFKIYEKEAITANSSFVMMYMDLDGFKAVNDTYGHKAGDLLLKVIAKRLTNVLQEKGDAIRIGGDELVALSRLRGECCNDSVYVLARKVLDTIEQKIVDGENTYHVSASIGVCCYPLHGDNMDQLLEKADGLMYAAKQGGRRQIKFADFTKKTKEPAPVSKLQAAPAMADIA